MLVFSIVVYPGILEPMAGPVDKIFIDVVGI